LRQGFGRRLKETSTLLRSAYAKLRLETEAKKGFNGRDAKCNTQTHYCLYSGFKISFFQKRRSRWNKDIDLNQLIDKMLVRDVTLLVTKIILLYLI
jgi:hypothetical protein